MTFPLNEERDAHHEDGTDSGVISPTNNTVKIRGPYSNKHNMSLQPEYY